MADTQKMSKLQRLADALPVANQRLVAQQKAARDIQMRQAVAQAPTSAPVTQTAQQTGGIAAANAGQQMVQQQQASTQQLGQLAQTGLQMQQQQNQQTLGGLEQGAREQQMANVQKFAEVSERAKQEIYDSRLQFSKDEMGREFLNQRQLDDFAALQATNAEEFQNYSQRVEQGYKRKAQMLDSASKLLSQRLQSENEALERLRTQSLEKELTEQERAVARRLVADKQKQIEDLSRKEMALKVSMAEAAAEAANTKARNVAVGTVLGAAGGAVAGSFAGNPAAGAVIGSSIGGGIAGML